MATDLVCATRDGLHRPVVTTGHDSPAEPGQFAAQLLRCRVFVGVGQYAGTAKNCYNRFPERGTCHTPSLAAAVTWPIGWPLRNHTLAGRAELIRSEL